MELQEHVAMRFCQAEFLPSIYDLSIRPLSASFYGALMRTDQISSRIHMHSRTCWRHVSNDRVVITTSAAIEMALGISDLEFMLPLIWSAAMHT